MKKLTKKQTQMLENYENSEAYSLRQVYGSFSDFRKKNKEFLTKYQGR